MATTFQNSPLNGGAPEFVPGQRIHFEIQPSTCVLDIDDYYNELQRQYHPALGHPDADDPELDYPFLEHPVDEFYGHGQDHYYFPPTGPWLNAANNHVQPMNAFSGQHQHFHDARMAGYTTTAQNYNFGEDLVRYGQRANGFGSKGKNRNKKKGRKGKKQRQKNEEEAAVKEVEKKDEKGGDAEVSNLSTW